MDFKDRRKIRGGDKNSSFIVKDVTLLGVELWSVGEAAAPALRFATGAGLSRPYDGPRHDGAGPRICPRR